MTFPSYSTVLTYEMASLTNKRLNQTQASAYLLRREDTLHRTVSWTLKLILSVDRSECFDWFYFLFFHCAWRTSNATEVFFIIVSFQFLLISFHSVLEEWILFRAAVRYGTKVLLVCLYKNISYWVNVSLLVLVHGKIQTATLFLLYCYHWPCKLVHV